MRNLIFIMLVAFTACKSGGELGQATTYDFPTPVDTHSRQINYQSKQVFLKDQSPVNATNNFDGARLNDFIQLNDSTYKALVLPENEPINPSPWYAFKVWSQQEGRIYLLLDYQKYRHRYQPKISRDGKHWQTLSLSNINLSTDSTKARLTLKVDADTLWIAAQEVISTHDVIQWCRQLAKHASVVCDTLGSSTLGRPLLELSLGSGSPVKKPTVVVLSRQHPPEVTGFMALQGFLDRILLENDSLSQHFLNRFNLLIYPLMNPDGVDLGHWRHNAGGVDLNRDWAYYRQPEIRQVAHRVASEVSKNRSSVILGLDFHSTYYDIYYTNIMDKETKLPDFTKSWLAAIKSGLEPYQINERPSGIGRPVSKSWFFTQFKAVGITYEIGDETDRPFVKRKGSVSAETMMKLLLKEFSKSSFN